MPLTLQDEYKLKGNGYLLAFSPAIILLIPLLYPFFKQYFNTGFLTASYIAVGISFVFMILYCSKFPWQYIKVTIIDLFLLIFAAYAFFNSWLQNKYFFSSDDALLLILAIGVYFVSKMAFQMDRNKTCMALKVVIIVTVAIQIVICSLQILKVIPSNSGLFPVTGIFLNPTILCTYLAIMFPILCYYVEESRSAGLKIVLGLICILIILTEAVAHSRMALFTSVVVSLVLLVNKFKSKRHSLALIVTTLLLSLSTFLALSKLNSTQGRFFIWKTSFSIYLSHPYQGIGFGSFKSYYNTQQAEYFLRNSSISKEYLLADENYYAYNEFLTLMIEEGLIGVLLFVIYLWLFIRGIRKVSISNGFKNSVEKYVLTAIICAVIMGFVSYPLEEPSLFFIIFLLLGVVSSRIDNYTILSARHISPFVTIGFYTFSFIIMATRAINVFKWYGLLNKEYITKSDLEDYNKLRNRLSSNSIFLVNYADNLVLWDEVKEAKQLLVQATAILPSTGCFIRLARVNQLLGNSDEAEKALVTCSLIVPSRFRFKMNLLDFYESTNEIDKGRVIAETIMKTPIKIQSDNIDPIINKARNFLINNPNK
ncbi:MAG TPA: O-antigen ligase family protein [Flavitalea sp.]|nr:O-antigen ligase family protein [Flavitalea sp.]